MNDVLRNRLIAAASAGALAIAGVLVQWHEGRRLTAYTDPVGVLTVCDGITGSDVIRGKTYSGAECDKLGAKHLAIAEHGARRQLAFYADYGKWRQAALIDFTFNLGEAKLSGSTMRAMFNEGDEAGGCRQLALWVKGRVRGMLVTLNGLVGRRADEMDLCMNWDRA